MKRLAILVCFTVVAVIFAACAAQSSRLGSKVAPTPELTPEPSAVPSQIRVIKPAEPTAFPPPDAELVPWDGIVEHLFFHLAITYPEMAFDGDYEEAGFDEYMVTLSEYKKILQSLYDRNYILVDINDVWSEYTDENGQARMRRNTLMIPEGKMPLILSFDDVNYYEYMTAQGFTSRLMVGRDGEIWSYGLDPEGNPVVSQDLDTITVLDKFVKERPDFSLNGAKGMLCLTGYEGILGYRTQTDSGNGSPGYEANRQNEIARVKPVVKKLKETGWYFASHSFSHLDLARASYERAKSDADRWIAEVGSLVGETTVMVYPYGARLDGNDVTQTGDAFKYYHALGFRIFASVGKESYSKIKTDISAVVCDRMHSDGGTLRREPERYSKFYDAAEVWDNSRPMGGKYNRSW